MPISDAISLPEYFKMATVSKLLESYSGHGVLRRENDPGFSCRVRYQLGIYQQMRVIPTTGEMLPTTRSVEGSIISADPILLHRLVSATDLVLTIEDGRTLPLFMMNPKTGKIRAKSGFRASP